jgi:hypothetical protein
MSIQNQVAELLYRKCPEVFSRYGDDFIMDLITTKSQGQSSVASVCKEVLAALAQEVSESRIMDRNAKINAYYVASTGAKHKVAENIPYYLLDKLVGLLTKKYNITMNDIEVRPADQSQYRRTSQPELAEAGFDREEFRRHMKDLEAREELRKTDPVSAKALDLRGQLPQVSKKKPEDDSMSINDPRHPQYAYTQAGQQGVAEDDAGDVEQRMRIKIEREKQRLAQLKKTDPEAYQREMAKREQSRNRMPAVSTFEQQGVDESPEEALKYATKAHAGQTRSGGDPYITHPMRVADHIRQYKQSHNLDALIAAAYLHDTIEDTDTTQEVLHDLFGGLVASLVQELTSDPAQIKKMGKAAYLSHKMAVMSSYGLVIKLADRLDNVKDITTAKTPEWRAKYAKETNQILDYIEKTRALSGTHKKLISLIRAKLAEIDNPPQVADEGISRRGILKGIAGAGALGAAGKASAIAGAFPTPSHQAAMYKAAADSNRAEAKRQAELKAKADAERLQKNTDQVDKEQRINHHKLDEFAPGNGDDGLPYAEYQVYQCNPEDQFEWIGGPLYQTDNMGMAHKYAYEQYVKHRPKAFMIWQERSQGSRGNYGVKGQSDEDYLDE